MIEHLRDKVEEIESDTEKKIKDGQIRSAEGAVAWMAQSIIDALEDLGGEIS